MSTAASPSVSELAVANPTIATTTYSPGPIVVMGVSGSGKSSVGAKLADCLEAIFVEGDSLHMSSPTGQSYSAKLDGTEAPYMGDPGTTSVSVKQLGKNTLQETDKRDGKVISVAKMTVAADGKSMSIAVEDKLHGSSMSFVAMKE